VAGAPQWTQVRPYRANTCRLIACQRLPRGPAAWQAGQREPESISRPQPRQGRATAIRQAAAARGGSRPGPPPSLARSPRRSGSRHAAHRRGRGATLSLLRDRGVDVGIEDRIARSAANHRQAVRRPDRELELLTWVHSLLVMGRAAGADANRLPLFRSGFSCSSIHASMASRRKRR
jgi:hypothetical protein